MDGVCVCVQVCRCAGVHVCVGGGGGDGDAVTTMNGSDANVCSLRPVVFSDSHGGL